MKICIITQVQNSFEYIPAWLAYHSRLADHIYLIDHNSDKDLRGLSNDNISVFRSNMNTYTLDTNINSLMAHKKLQGKYDWVFILDIDEFLPFGSRDEAHSFCHKFRWCSCVSMYWRNGYAKQEQSKLKGNTAFDFQEQKAKTRKLIYNTKLRNHFWIGHGNHAAQFPIFGIPFLNLRPLVKKSPLPLFHLPFINIPTLIEKLENFPTKNFKNKIYRHAQHLEKKYGPNWYIASISHLEKLWLVTNYRVVKAKDIINENDLRFETIMLLNGLDQRIKNFRTKLSKCIPGTKVHNDEGEIEIINKIKKSGKKNYKNTILRHTKITPDNTIELIYK